VFLDLPRLYPMEYSFIIHHVSLTANYGSGLL
jgi:hypothetical protein